MPEKSQIIHPPNRLKSKVRTGGPGAVNAQALDRAEAVIQNMADSFLEWVVGDLDAIQDSLSNLRNGGDAEMELTRIHSRAHDIKGQGGSFGYDLMTEMGTLLTRFVKTLSQPVEKDLDLIQVCVDSMRLVVEGRLNGDGGAEGQALLKRLSGVADHLSAHGKD